MQPVWVWQCPRAWAVCALVMATVVALVAAMLYIHPPGQKIVTFFTQDAASIRPGDQVARSAGVNVGKVDGLSLDSNQVRVRVGVDDYAFVGNQSQVQVRMLTVVGGYYVNLVSLGDRPLGSTPISAERVTMPYSLIKTLADATKITDNVDAKPISESLNQVAQGLSGTNVESITAVVDAGNSLISTMDKQRGQVSAILNMSDEYIRSLSDFGGELKEMVRKASQAVDPDHLQQGLGCCSLRAWPTSSKC